MKGEINLGTVEGVTTRNQRIGFDEWSYFNWCASKFPFIRGVVPGFPFASERTERLDRARYFWEIIFRIIAEWGMYCERHGLKPTKPRVRILAS